MNLNDYFKRAFLRYNDVTQEPITTIQVIDWIDFFQDFFDIKHSFWRKNPRSGVYVFDNCYVGQSYHIRNRIKSHICDAINSRHFSKDFQNNLRGKIRKGEKMTIDIVSGNTMDERSVYMDLQSKGYKIFNKLENTRG